MVVVVEPVVVVVVVVATVDVVVVASPTAVVEVSIETTAVSGGTSDSVVLVSVVVETDATGAAALCPVADGEVTPTTSSDNIEDSRGVACGSPTVTMRIVVTSVMTAVYRWPGVSAARPRRGFSIQALTDAMARCPPSASGWVEEDEDDVGRPSDACFTRV